MMQITFQTVNSAFTPDGADSDHADYDRRFESARILREIADALMENSQHSGNIHDLNGNLVGYFDLK